MKKTFIFFLFFACGIIIHAQTKNIVILHTNDTHSRIEPIPQTDKSHPNTGGVERRMAYIKDVREKNKNVLLFDAGDFVQGTPYFNLFKGKVEVQAMNLMQYDVATLGNHEFDYGMATMEKFVKDIKFDIVCSNYDFSNTAIASYVKPYTIIDKDGVKIGIISTNVDPKGLIASSNYEGMIFLPRVETANKYAKLLRDKKHCDMIICISHCGYQQDIDLAKNSFDIDIIIGGHSHTFMDKPDIITNKSNRQVLMFQTGARGVNVGRIDVELQKRKN